MSELLGRAPALVLGVSVAAALVIMLLPERARSARAATALTAAVTKLALLAALLPLVFDGDHPAVGWELLPGLRLELVADPLSMIFALLGSTLWLATTVYALGYLRGDPQQRRFFAFFSLCVTATVGIAFSANLVTFVVFYEMLTLVTYPLVSHKGTPEALKAARAYLYYALAGGLVLLTGTVVLHLVTGTTSFSAGGNEAVAAYAQVHPAHAVVIVALLLAGLGVKAALVPLHSWLPLAMVAPAPVSALLHAVAVVKAGAFGIVRTVGDLFGVRALADLGVLDVLLVCASVTILYGSARALMQTDLKKRLAYSTVSQVSYIALGLAMVAPLASVGGVVHLFHQGITKIVLFFCAGLFAERHGATTVASLVGMGRRMPWTSAAFTIGAFGMIGLPPLAGFVSKWTLAQGAIASDRDWVVAVLVASAALNCAYFLPVVYRIWWPPLAEHGVSDGPGSPDAPGSAGSDDPRPIATRAMVVPTVVVAVLTVAAGAFAFADLAPLGLARQIVEGAPR